MPKMPENGGSCSTPMQTVLLQRMPKELSFNTGVILQKTRANNPKTYSTFFLIWGYVSETEKVDLLMPFCLSGCHSNLPGGVHPADLHSYEEAPMYGWRRWRAQSKDSAGSPVGDGPAEEEAFFRKLASDSSFHNNIPEDKASFVPSPHYCSF